MADVTIFNAARAASLTNPTAATVFLNNSISTAAALVKVPLQPLGVPPTVMFMLNAWGKVTGGTTTNFTASIQSGSSATAASNTTYLAGTARAVNSASTNWSIAATCAWDATSLTLTGYMLEQGGATVAASLTPATAVTALNLATTQGSFVVTGLFSASNAGNLCTLDGFTLRLINAPSGE